MDLNLFEYKGEPSSKAKYNIWAIAYSPVKERFELVVL
jgi:hypothetical protein